MPGYADLDAVRTILNLPPEGDDADADARLVALNGALSAIFETKVGRTWSAEDPLTPRVEAVPVKAVPHGILELPPPGILSLVSLTVAPTWDGAAWVDGTVVDLADIGLAWQTADGAYLGVNVGGPLIWPWSWSWWWGDWSGWWGWGDWSGPSAGSWRSTVLVEAIWADQQGAAPIDVVEALTFLVAEEYKQERASPESLLGPDGLTISSRNPWAYQRVTGVIERHRVPERITI